MLVCNVSLRPSRAGIAAGLVEAVSATDATATGNVVFATLVDDPASVRDRVDAYTGEIMREAATAAAVVDGYLPVTYVGTIVQAMTALDTISATVGVSDPYWSNVKFLAGFEGANNSTGAPGMTDESLAASGTGTVAGAQKISTTQFKFGTSSLLCSIGSVVYSSSANHSLGSASFTIEAWIYPSSVAGTFALMAKCGSTSPNLGWMLYLNGAVLTFAGGPAGTTFVTVVSGGTVVTNAWQHVCVDFDGTKYRMYINGVMVGSSTTVTSFFNPAKGLALGANSDNANNFSGFIDEARLTIGVARYHSDSGFTVPTTAFPRM